MIKFLIECTIKCKNSTITLMPIEIAVTAISLEDSRLNNLSFTVEPGIDNFGGVMGES